MADIHAISNPTEKGEELLCLEYHGPTRTDRAKVTFSYSGPDVNATGYFVNSGIIMSKVTDRDGNQLLLSDFDCGRLGDMCVNARDKLSEKWHNVLGGWVLEERM